LAGFYNIVVEATDTKVAVEIDIKPGSNPNCFNLNGNVIIPVAVLGSDTFDVRDLRTDSTLSFDGRAVRIRGKKGPLCHYDFYDDDTFEDLVCQFDDDPGEITADCKVCLEKRRHFS